MLRTDYGLPISKKLDDALVPGSVFQSYEWGDVVFPLEAMDCKPRRSEGGDASSNLEAIPPGPSVTKRIAFDGAKLPEQPLSRNGDEPCGEGAE